MNARRLIAGLIVCVMVLFCSAELLMGTKNGMTAEAVTLSDFHFQKEDDHYVVYRKFSDHWVVWFLARREPYAEEDLRKLFYTSWEGALNPQERSVVQSVSLLSEIDGLPVTDIQDDAFYGCTSMMHVTLPDGLISIGEDAFNGCFKLDPITLPDSVTTIGESAFSGCRSLKSIVIPSGVTSIGDRMFEFCFSLESISIPDTVTSIDYNAFKDCSSLQSITIPGSVTKISERAFVACEGLKSFIVSGNPNYIAVDGVLMTADQKTLVRYPAGKAGEHYTIPDGVTRIAWDAFNNCAHLRTLTVPSSVEHIYGENRGTIDEAIGFNFGYYHNGEQIADFMIYGEPGTIIEQYAELYDFAFNGAKAETARFCDLNADNTVNASDAAIVLIASAAVGAGDESAAIPAEKGDVNGDGLVNASDAALILIYAAAVGAGYEGTLPEYFAK